MNAQHFTHPPIEGIHFTQTLPEGCALVLEGGGTRGFYSAGVFEAFLEKGILFPYVIGVSAGAANALSYISGQPMRNRQVVEYYVASPQYVSKRNLLFHGSMFNMEYVFRTIPRQHIALDWEAFQRNEIRFLTGAMNCRSGETVWFEKEDINEELTATIASCSVPIISPVVHFQGYDLLDGGVSDPIPIEKSIADGNQFHVIVLTRNQGYVKAPFGHKRILSVFYRKYPQVVNAMIRRHETYARQLALCERLEREGKAMIIRPLRPLQVGRTENDTRKLLALYDEGHQEGRDKIKQILAAAQALRS